MRTTEIGAWTPPNGATPQDPVRGTDVARAFRGHGRRLQTEPCVANRGRRLVHDLVLRRSPGLQRKVVAGQLDLDSGHVRVEHTQRLFEQFLPGLVPFQHRDRRRRHLPPRD
jgi:hypothetical protein